MNTIAPKSNRAESLSTVDHLISLDFSIIFFHLLKVDV